MYYDLLVNIPENIGKITIKKKGDSAYVLHEYERVYHPEKHYNVPKRAIIGKVSSENPSQMYPNEKYELYYPNEPIPEELPDPDRSYCIKIGAYLIINKILEEYQLPDMLKKWVHEDYGLFLDLVSYLIINEENIGQYYPNFAFEHPLFSKNMKIYSDSKVSRFLSTMTPETSVGFLNDWNENRDHKDRIYVSYDSTNKNCQAGDIDLVEFGKAKIDTGTPIFNLALAFDTTNKVPLFYEEYPGSINDVSQFTFMIDKAVDYGYKKLGFILDRGYFSRDNIEYMDAKEYEFIIMVKGCKALVSNIIEEQRNKFETQRACSIRSYKVYGTTIERNLFPTDKKKRYFHLYYNPSKQAAEREQLEQKIDRYKVYLEKYIGKKIEFSKTYTDYFDFKYNSQGVLLSVAESADVIQQELTLCGYFCIVTSEEMTAEAALIHYKSRDISEKLFRADKTFIGSHSMRVQSNEAISSKIFIEFVALIVRNRMYNLLKEEMLKIEKKPNFFTVPAAIQELEKIQMGRRKNGLYKLNYAITKKQKQILAAFGLDDQYVKEKAEKITNSLKHGEALTNIIDEEGDEDGTDENDYFD